MTTNSGLDNYYNRKIGTAISSYSFEDSIYGFESAFTSGLEQAGIPTATQYLQIHVNDSTINVIQKIAQDLNMSFNYRGPHTAVLRNVRDSGLLVIIHDIGMGETENSQKNTFKVYEHELGITVTGTVKSVEATYNLLKTYNIDPAKIGKIDWKYVAGNNTLSRTVILEDNFKIEKEYYPFINTDSMSAYVDSFLKSTENILILLGTPGTGKTTLIKHIIMHHKMDALVFYDDGMMQTDRILVEFLTKPKNDILILEDADILLEDRSKGKNQVMTKLLNASDGIVNVVNKKIIITANVASRDDIDPALLRPGRCFDCIEFRPLTKTESLEAAKHITGAEDFINSSNNTKFTLSELFNAKKQNIRDRVSLGFHRLA